MARKRIEDNVPQLQSWDDVNITLAEIGEAERLIEAIEADMQAGIDNLKLGAEMDAAPHQRRITELGSQIKRFVDEHRDEMDGKKTKTLTFGSTGFRKSTKVILPRGAAKVAQIIRELKSRAMTDCVITPPEKVDKDALRKYPANEVIAVGANLQVEDTFWYEVDREQLAQK